MKRLTEAEIQVRIVPTHLRWPERGTDYRLDKGA